MSEILNLDYNYKRLLVKALNKAQTISEAAFLLGITERTIHRWKNKFNIVFNNIGKFWEEDKPKPVIIKYK